MNQRSNLKEMYSKVVNISPEPVTYEVSVAAGFKPQKQTIDSGEVAEERTGYCEPRGGQRELPSVIERLTNGRVLPVTHPKAKAFLEARAERAARQEAEKRTVRTVAKAPQDKDTASKS